MKKKKKEEEDEEEEEEKEGRNLIKEMYIYIDYRYCVDVKEVFFFNFLILFLYY